MTRIAAALSALALAGAAPPHETVSPAFRQPIPNLPGKMLVAVVVDYPPGGTSPPHRHASSSFIMAYVLSGAVRSSVNGSPARTYRAGETWAEPPGAHHGVSANASDTAPARLLAVFVVDATDRTLTIPDRPAASGRRSP